MKRRIFIAINLPEKIKKRLKEYREKFNYLPVRWTKVPSLHLTLVFIGYVDNEQMLEACKITRKIAEDTEPFFINFKKIVLGPPGKEPRMVWLEGEKSEELTRLRDALQEALFSADTGFNHKESRSFSPHITLARITPHTLIKSQDSRINGGNKGSFIIDKNNQKGVGVKMGEWRQTQINPAEIETDFSAPVEVNSIEVMESDLKFDGAEYATLEECPLGG